MQLTKYAESLPEELRYAPLGGEPTGATLHAKWMAHDNGETFLLTGKDVYGRPFKKTARSLAGAYAKMRAAWGLQRAWHIRSDGSRRLAIRR